MTKLDETLTMLKALTDANGIPGNEKEVRDVFESYIRPLADEVTVDNLGSSIVKSVDFGVNFDDGKIREIKAEQIIEKKDTI